MWRLAPAAGAAPAAAAPAARELARRRGRQAGARTAAAGLVAAACAAAATWGSGWPGVALPAFAAPGRQRQGRKKTADAERKAAGRLEAEFLESLKQGIGEGVDPLALADQVARLKTWSLSDRRRMLTGDWRLCASDPGDLLVQFGSGLHGLPFVSVQHLFLSLRPASKQLRTFEVLSMGPVKSVTTILKGDLRWDDEDLKLEYNGMVDKEGSETRQERAGATRTLTAQALYTGLQSLVLRVKPTEERKGGLCVFAREGELAAALKEATGEKIKVMPAAR